MKKFRHLKEFIKENKKSYILGIICLIIIDTIQLLVPKITKALADNFELGILNHQSIIKYTLLILSSGLVLMFGRYYWRVKIFTPSRRMEYYLRDKIFKKLLTLSPQFFTENTTGDLMALATNDVNAIRFASGGGIMMIVDGVFMMTLSLIMMVQTVGWQLFKYILVVIPIIIIFVTIFGQIVHKRFTKVQETFGEVMEKSREHYSGVRIIKSFSKEKIFEEIFLESSMENYKANLNHMRVQSFFRPFIFFIAGFTVFLIIRFGGESTILGKISLGDFLAFNMYLDMLIWPLMAFGMVINFFQRGLASLKRISDLLDQKPKIIDPIPNTKRINFESLEFKDVSYKYPNTERMILKNINFRLEKGKSLAILGSTGSGKSTIIKLLLRLYDTEEGTILYNNQNLKKISLSGIREGIGIVFQESFLFSESIGENIAFDKLNQKSEEKVIESSKLSDLHSNIENFPQKYQTIVGEMGVTLSGGQKQRVSLARAIYKNPSLLIMDDAFSAVDTKTEAKILNNLKSLKDTSFIIISHRVSTVKNCDEILILDDGEIVERGTDKELMELKGLYYKTAIKQRLEEKIEGKNGI